MSEVGDAQRDLVVANRILANEQVADAYGHISVRHPDRPGHFLLSRSLAPELVEIDDLVEFDAEGQPVGDSRPPYQERFIHAAVYEARTDVNSVVHAHAEETLPFGLTGTPLKAVLHIANGMGTHVPVWDIRTVFGDTNMLVGNMAQARDMVETLGSDSVTLMRGHGFTAVAGTIIEAVRLSIYLPRNARVLLEALRLGEVIPLTEGEIRIRNDAQKATSPEMWRAWEYWASRAGCADRIGPRPGS